MIDIATLLHRFYQWSAWLGCYMDFKLSWIEPFQQMQAEVLHPREEG